MKITRVAHGGEPRTAIVEDQQLRVLRDVAVMTILTASYGERERLAAQVDAELALDEARLLAPLVPNTIRDFSVFERHVEGASMYLGGPDVQVNEAWFERPTFYFSNPNGVSGNGGVIQPPAIHSGLDLELEVAAIVGRGGRNLSVEQAGDCIVGYTIFNDWSERDIIARETRLPLGLHKAKDFANTLGPWIVTPDELEPHRRGDRLDLDARAFVNGTEIGGENLQSMMWSFAELVHFAALGAQIMPGDVIGSGTVGGGCLFELWGRNQARVPEPLRPGDEVRLEVDAIGVLTNTIGDPQPELPPLRPARRQAAV